MGLTNLSTPVTWAEVRACRHPHQLQFTADTVLDRIDDLGDLLADLSTAQTLPPHSPNHCLSYMAREPQCKQQHSEDRDTS
jgi:DNA primase